MKLTQLRAEVLVANTEQLLHIPAATVRIEFSTPSNFPIRVSFIQGEVAGDDLAGFTVFPDETTLRIGRFDGPVFFSAEQPHALLDADCFSIAEFVSTAPTGGSFSSAFGAGFDIGQ